MPTAARTQHKTIADTSLAYVTNSSVISTDPQYIAGQNVLTSLRQWLERRPGFSAPVEVSPTGFTNVRRQMAWETWAGQFFLMACDVLAGQAKVYKLKVGTDLGYQLIFTSSVAEPFDFVVSNNEVFFGNGTDMRKYDGTTVKTWGITAPASGPTITLIAGTLNVYNSWCYVVTYWDANDSHESSPSPISACTGVFTNKYVQLGLTASSNSRVTGIRVYRTPDGGSQDPQLMQEIGGSPFPNTTGSVTDTTPDISLGTRVAPAFLRNDPPPASKGFVAYAGRIWGFQNNTTYYSGFEEIANGVPEECWPSGLDGNFYPFPNVVTAHAKLVDGIAVFTPENIYKIEGESLDTFRRYTLLERRGTRSRTSVTSFGGSVAWFDTAAQVWVSDLGEIGRDIRPDLVSIDQSQVYIAVHISGIYHWLVLLDGAQGRLFVYDLDRRQWMPPWTVGTTASALVSAETSLGLVQLFLARNKTKCLALASGTYLDDASTYSASVTTNMWRMTPENNPAWKGNNDWLELKTDAVLASAVTTLTDDDPTTGTFVAPPVPAGIPSPDIVSGANLKTTRYNPDFQTAQMLAVKITWAAANTNWHLYQFDVSQHPVGE